jgi:endonuclease YncB( thermonuclease family)
VPFTLIKGHFKPRAGIPDGDSVRFLADDVGLWNRLEGEQVELGTADETRDTVQLRFEGIDAIEKDATKPLSTDARESMFDLIGFDEASEPEPRGFVLARMTDDRSGRPIAFAFAGETSLQDGDEVFLEGPLLRDSVNFRQMQAGFAYPLYYNTLFADLRNEFNQALASANDDGVGYWPHDKTTDGVTVTSRADLATIPPIWPKLWRRLEEFLRSQTSLAGFIGFLEERDERVDILSVMDERGLQDLVEVQGDTVRMIEPPENLRVVAEAGRRTR